MAILVYFRVENSGEKRHWREEGPGIHRLERSEQPREINVNKSGRRA